MSVTPFMNLVLRLFVALPIFPHLAVGAEEAPARVVVAIRYLQEEGVSHSHLHLFDGNGRFLRQLTREESGQDFDPVLSPDGRSVVYRRVKGKDVQWRRVSVDGGSDRLLPAAPDWYTKAFQEPEAFELPPSIGQGNGSQRIETAARPGEIEYASASGRFSLF